MLRSRDKAVSVKIEGTRKDHVCYYNPALLAEDGRHNPRRVSAVARRSGEALRQYDRSIQDPATDHDRVVRIEPHGSNIKFCRRLQRHHRHRPSHSIESSSKRQQSRRGAMAASRRNMWGEIRRRSHDAAIETHGPIF